MTIEGNVMVDMDELIRYVETLSKVNASGHKVDSELKKAVGMLSDLSGVTTYHERVREEAEKIAMEKRLSEFTTRELMYELRIRRRGIKGAVFAANSINRRVYDDFEIEVETKGKDLMVLAYDYNGDFEE